MSESFLVKTELWVTRCSHESWPTDNIFALHKAVYLASLHGDVIFIGERFIFYRGREDHSAGDEKRAETLLLVDRSIRLRCG